MKVKLKDTIENMGAIPSKTFLWIAIPVLSFAVFRLIKIATKNGNINLYSKLMLFVSFLFLGWILLMFLKNYSEKKLIKLSYKVNKFTIFIIVAFIYALLILSRPGDSSDARAIMYISFSLFLLYVEKSPCITENGILFSNLKKWKEMSDYSVNYENISIKIKGGEVKLLCEESDIEKVKEIFRLR